MQTERIEIQVRPPRSYQGYLKLSHKSFEDAIPIGEGLSLGRSDSCALKIADSFVSLRHCRIERRDQNFYLRDLRSRNGTYLNGTKILEALLNDGDRIRLGETTLNFHYDREQKHLQLTLQSKNGFWNQQLSRLPGIAQSSLSVLLLGNSGTGKEILAQEIHRLSSRKDAPFVSVNCSALSESLVESELFGHLRGSFTGATNDRKGAFEAARAGTLFLDEIGDLPLSLQPKLLRALENQEIRPVGSDRTIKTDVRILAATHANLKAKVLSGEFRSDLYFRLQGLQLSPPDLKDRMEDFEDLLYFFAKQYRVRFSVACIHALKQHNWPGNIRELRNFVSRCQALFSGQSIEPHHLEDLLDRDTLCREEICAPPPRETSLIKELEKKLIVESLSVHRGNQSRCAKELGLPKSTLNDRIHFYGIDPKRFKD